MVAAPLRVMTSHRQPRATTNPYIVQLDAALSAESGIEYHRFSWGRALTGSMDVFHTHWTEAIMDGGTPVRRWSKQAALLVAVLMMRLRGVAIVRTIHNLEQPSGLSIVERAVLALVEGGTRLRIRINDVTDLPDDLPVATILHGDYVEWFADQPRHAPISGRFGYFGLIRRYKGVETLVESFGQLPDPEVSLRIGGRPSTPEIAETLMAMAGADPRIQLDLKFLDDNELVEIATESELVVLPYRFMHNSGSVLAALSLDRPVLVPRNEANHALSDEVGPGWIQFFDGDLSPDDLRSALDNVRAAALTHPDLSARGWARAAAAHVAAYAEAAHHA